MNTPMRIAIIAVAAILATECLQAQISISHTELYNGDNVITFWAEQGIKRIRSKFKGTSARYAKVVNADELEAISDCPNKQEVRIRVGTGTESLSDLVLTIIDCDGSVRNVRLTNRTWYVEEARFPDVMVGDTVCKSFRISVAGTTGLLNTPFGEDVPQSASNERLDSVSFTIPNAFAVFESAPPVTLPTNAVYHYVVCFRATEPGEYRFPVRTWIARKFPTEGLTNYIVADTGVVRVLPNPDADVREPIEPFMPVPGGKDAQGATEPDHDPRPLKATADAHP